MNTMPWWASVAGSLGFSLAWPQPCRRGCRTGASQATGNSHHPAMRPPATHRPHGVRLAAAGDLHHQLHVGVVVSVAAPRHVHKLVRQADVPGARHRQCAWASAQVERSKAREAAPGGAAEGGVPSGPGRRPRPLLPSRGPVPGGRTRRHRWAQSRTARHPGQRPPSCSGLASAGGAGLASPTTLPRHSLCVGRHVVGCGHSHKVQDALPAERLVRPAPHGADTLGGAHWGGELSGQRRSEPRGKARRPRAPAARELRANGAPGQRTSVVGHQDLADDAGAPAFSNPGVIVTCARHSAQPPHGHAVSA